LGVGTEIVVELGNFSIEEVGFRVFTFLGEDTTDSRIIASLEWVHRLLLLSLRLKPLHDLRAGSHLHLLRTSSVALPAVNP